ncbi:MAG TPA: OmpH family outer membrane protein [Cytophagaceae bacterium]|jgi:outer membrane protein|nr:OmpH family outer membrane protein [Cytophagaceae bacterium]
MKNKLILLVAIAMMTSFHSFAQTTSHHTKIGYTNLEYILSLLPDTKRIESELQTYEKQLKAQMDSKMAEFEKKYQDYEKGKSSGLMSDVIKADKEKELTGLQASIKEFEETAQSSLQKKQASLLEPVLDKIQKSIERVAAANGFTYILSTHADYGGSAIILFAKNKDEDISNLVLKDLGVTPPAPAATPTSGANGVTPPKSTAPATGGTK